MYFIHRNISYISMTDINDESYWIPYCTEDEVRLMKPEKTIYGTRHKHDCILFVKPDSFMNKLKLKCAE